MGSCASAVDEEPVLVEVEGAERKPKFSYFPLKARGFPILLALEVGGVDYDFEVISALSGVWWSSVKATGLCPFGCLPLLELADGTCINETNACLTAAGLLAGLMGSTETAQLVSAMLACKAADVFSEFGKVHPHKFNVAEWDAGKRALLDNWAQEKSSVYMQQLEALCDPAGKFTADGNTVGELHVFSLLYHMKVCGFMQSFSPNLQKFYSRIAALPGVQRCMDNKTRMGELHDHFVPCPDTGPAAPPASAHAPPRVGFEVVVVKADGKTLGCMVTRETEGIRISSFLPEGMLPEYNKHADEGMLLRGEANKEVVKGSTIVAVNGERGPGASLIALIKDASAGTSLTLEIAPPA